MAIAAPATIDNLAIVLERVITKIPSSLSSGNNPDLKNGLLPFHPPQRNDGMTMFNFPEKSGATSYLSCKII
ncbi:hypothetical protein [Sphingorhabdus sp. Alg239-R122]|uniref:hypothetical protein n=1 Tax=Sphingorhabdus sp. Alg239-R122 TaxID=2305989 RepID=UPI0013DB24C9|nr:hypothetical protein [Sphingorhabdus sp. Alg239-R122]